MVLNISLHSNESAQVLRGIERAVHKKMPAIPFRLVDVTPSAHLEYFISSCHWLDAFSISGEGHFQRLADV